MTKLVLTRRFDYVQAPGWQSNFLQTAVHLRSRLFHLPYGDQAIFVDKEAFRCANPHFSEVMQMIMS